MRLFLSEQCTGDNDADYESPQERERYAQRRKDPGIPADAEHQSKPDIALNLIEQAVAAGVDHGYIVTDRNSGRFPNHMLSKSCAEFRFVSEDTNLFHPDDHPNRKHSAHTEDVRSETPEEVAECLGDDLWTEITGNEGTKKSLSGEFSRTRIREVKRSDTG